MLIHKGTITLETPRLILRKFRHTDAVDMFNLFNEVGMNRIAALHDIKNIASGQVMIKSDSYKFMEEAYEQ